MRTMNVNDLRSIDLNLLVVFHVLMQERNVTRSAAKLNLSQSAVSAALARLRAATDDPLFERSQTGMQPTARALELAGPVALSLGNLAKTLAPSTAFNAQDSQRTFHLAMSDDIETVIAPWLLEQSLAAQWGVRFAFHQTHSHRYAESLSDPTIDLVLCATPAEIGVATIRTQTLFTGGYCCLFSPTQLAAGAPLSEQTFREATHLRVSHTAQRGFIDDLLESSGIQRSVPVSLSHFAGVSAVLANTPTLVTMPDYAAKALANAAGLATSPTPIATPRFTVSMMWRATNESALDHVWLRETIAGYSPSK